MDRTTEDYVFVTDRHPDAFCIMDRHNGTFKVYADRATNVALSQSCGAADRAWADAARAIRERDAARKEQAK